ncbi:hypothetical protein [Caballeronia sp. ATUFL_M2_KS44]|uniref:hypothetical protein n=1 Tax=Caballeronia sp. ATUFL_M2_KS44 TaxID=2921767 RepID=UPI0020294283|nr:hypothetical protein [Caballeronia sp. ATUFL_M2_KS44]
MNDSDADFLVQARSLIADFYRCDAGRQDLSIRARLRAAFDSIYLLLIVIAARSGYRSAVDVDVILISDVLHVLRATAQDVDALISLAQWLTQDESHELPPLSIADALAVVDRLRLFAAYHLRSA